MIEQTHQSPQFEKDFAKELIANSYLECRRRYEILFDTSCEAVYVGKCSFKTTDDQVLENVNTFVYQSSINKDSVIFLAFRDRDFIVADNQVSPVNCPEALIVQNPHPLFSKMIQLIKEATE